MISISLPEGGPPLPSGKAGLARLLRSMIARGFTFLGMPEPAPVILECLCVRDADSAALNCEHMGCHGPTNILSFPGSGAMPEGWHLGSLVLSLDALYRECLLYGQQPDAYLSDLLAHGLGHLFGFDHGPDMDRACACMLGLA